MPTVCVCGNEKPAPESFTVRLSPCRCEVPGKGRRARVLETGIPSWVSESQYNERKKHGLPLVTDIERGAFSRWG